MNDAEVATWLENSVLVNMPLDDDLDAIAFIDKWSKEVLGFGGSRTPYPLIDPEHPIETQTTRFLRWRGCRLSFPLGSQCHAARFVLENNKLTVEELAIVCIRWGIAFRPGFAFTSQVTRYFGSVAYPGPLPVWTVANDYGLINPPARTTGGSDSAYDNCSNTAFEYDASASCIAYLEALDQVKSHPRLQLMLRYGGIVSRIALQIGGLSLAAKLISAPSQDWDADSWNSVGHIYYEPYALPADDPLARILLGQFNDPQGRSIWPVASTFYNSYKWRGIWTTANERWFLDRWRKIGKREAQAKTATKWLKDWAHPPRGLQGTPAALAVDLLTDSVIERLHETRVLWDGRFGGISL